ncbi:type II and III secretion system protein family protein [Occallatibacter savannae]|uniref:type II and III secretion system protein family protein n=1 Tax=Occallatibacter savannae TaxID=1002691 RepID=UPI000D689D1B|nr:pilus assembly protein N-terminal domain-containing protein [Occallatibacter savannae]
MAQGPPAGAQPAAATSQDSTNDLSLAVGKSVVLDLARPVTRIVVGAGGFAEAQAVSPTQILLNGKAPGETSLIIWDQTGGRQFFNVTVRASSFASNDQLEGLRRELRAELPGQNVRVSQDNGVIFLRGTVTNLNSSDRAVMIASTAGKVVNLLNVNVPAPEPQILLKVRFASVDRNRLKQLGINFALNGLGNTIGSIGTGQFNGINVGQTGTLSVGGTNIFGIYPGIGLGASIQALETRGLAEVLAEPNVLAKNGHQASFLAGGEYPYPVAQSGAVSGAASPITIQYKQYGVLLAFLPTITNRGTIRLQVAPEVSALDYGNAVNIGGATVPALTIRRVKTEVELSEGQTFIIGGLLDNRETENFQKIPFIGDIPILGKFFQSMQRTRTNTELIVTVTPEIVSPIDVGTPVPEIKFPSGFLPPNSTIAMHTPDQKPAGSAPAPPPATIPVEKLIESMKPEQPLVLDSGMGVGGGGGGSSASTQQAPQ